MSFCLKCFKYKSSNKRGEVGAIGKNVVDPYWLNITLDKIGWVTDYYGENALIF